MSRALRIQFPGAFYHIYNRGVNKQAIFRTDSDRRIFLQFLADNVRNFGLRLFAFCLMDNHFHLFLQTSLANLDRSMQRLQGSYASYTNLTYDRTGSLFQGRYKSTLVDADAYALILARYIHQNPIKAGMVKHLEDFLWSSYPSYTRKLPTWNWLETHWLLKLFHENQDTAVHLFEIFHQESSSDTEWKMIGRMERIWGTKDFCNSILNLLRSATGV